MKSKKYLRALVALLGLVSLYGMSACGSAAVQTSNSNPIPTATNPVPTSEGPVAPKLTQTALDALTLTDYPADIDIADFPGISHIAFVTTFSPAAVLAVDLDSNPLQVIPGKGLPNLTSLVPSAGQPNTLFISDATHAYLLTSSKLILFNPSNATVYDEVSLLDPITLNSPLARINPDGSSASPTTGSFTPSYPGAVVAVGSKVFVSFSNLSFASFSLTFANQGIVRVFDVQNDQLSDSNPNYFVTSGYNTTGLTALPSGEVLVTNTGITEFTPDYSNQLPVTPASVDKVNSQNLNLIGTLDLGLSTPAFRSWAVTPQGDKAFIGSASGGFVMEINLNPFQVLRGISNPIVVTSEQLGTDYINDVVMANDGGGIYPISYNHSKVYAVDLTGSDPLLISQTADLSSPGNPGITGAGPGAMRPGKVGTDFNGATLFVLTSSPGSIAALFTY